MKKKWQAAAMEVNKGEQASCHRCLQHKAREELEFQASVQLVQKTWVIVGIWNYRELIET